MLTIHPLRAFKDNYIWLGVEDESRSAFVVDPGDAKPVLNFLREKNIKLNAILITHKHTDHVGGIAALLEKFPDVPVYANPIEQVAHANAVKPWPAYFQVLDIPGHTRGHIAYVVSNNLFCGDTLFGAGCGRLFEGTAEMMLSSLKKLSALPDNTFVYCGHEYTKSNLQFALYLEPNNTEVQQRMRATQEKLEQGLPTLPSTIGLEKKTNPFLRCHEPSIVKAVESRVQKKLNSEVDVFFEMREMKNSF